MPVHCPDCAAAVPVGNRFCEQCGAKVTNPPPQEAAGERRQLSVMFCDLVESTALSSSLDPEDMRELLQRYHSLTGEIVARHHGHVAQYLGDGILVYFGYPQALENDAERAVLCGLAIISTLREENISPEGSDEPLRARIGIHTGPVVTGYVGSDRLAEGLAVGATPNIAARVQQEAEVDEVWISQTTRNLVASSFALDAIGARQLKGIDSSVALFRARTYRDRENAAEDLPFIGREPELQVLLDACRSECPSGSRLVLVRGEAGIGKSRLIRELIATAPELTGSVLRCSAHHRNTALYPLKNWLKERAGIEDGLPEEARRTKFEAFRKSLPPLVDNESLSTTLSRFAGVTGGEENAYQKEPVMRAMLETFAADGIAVLMLEDLHWADASTIEFLDRLLSDRGRIVVATGRSEFEHDWPDSTSIREIELQNLSAEQTRTLVSKVPGLPRNLSRLVAERTDGIPLFAEELARMLAAEGPGRQSDDFDGIPPTLRDLLMARIDALGPAREVLQIGAVVGRTFSPSLVEQIAPHLSRELVEQAASAGLVYHSYSSGEHAFSFRHALIQEVAYQSLLRRRRKLLHGKLADLLRTSTVADLEPETVARHLDGAQEYEDAADFYGLAGRTAFKKRAYVEAIAHLRTGLDLIPKLPEGEARDRRELFLLQRLAIPSFAVLGYTQRELVDTYRRSRELAASVGSADESFVENLKLWGFHVVHADRVDVEQAVEWLTASSAAATRPDAAAVADYARGTTSFYAGDYETALPSLQRAVSFYREQDQRQSSTSPLFNGWVVMAWALSLSGKLDEAWQTVESALKFARDSQDPFLVAQSLDHKAVVAHALGFPPDEVAKIARDVERLNQEHRFDSHYSAVMFIGWHKALQGDAAGVAEVEREISIMREIGTRQPLGNMLLVLIEALRAMDRADEALEVTKKASEMGDTQATGYHLPGVALARAEIEYGLGRKVPAHRLWQSALEIAKKQGATTLALRSAMSRYDHTGIGSEDVRDALKGIEGNTGNRFVRDARDMLMRASEG